MAEPSQENNGPDEAAENKCTQSARVDVPVEVGAASGFPSRRGGEAQSQLRQLFVDSFILVLDLFICSLIN